MTKKSGLGKGLDALIPVGDFTPMSGAPASGGVLQLPVNAIAPNPRQPRTSFDSAELAELAASIREHGVIQPILVTRGEKHDHFTLVAGERRLMAARQAGLDTIPAIVREASEQEQLELALIENVQRADLGPLETASAYHLLDEEFGLSHEEIAARVGKSRTAVTNTLRLLKLPAIVQQSLAEQKITEGHARALLGLATPQSQVAALQTILKQALNVRQTEELVRRLSGEKPQSAPKPPAPPEIKALEERLRGHFGTKVTLSRRGKGGTMVIHYYSDEELESLLGQILGDSEIRS